jgi:hypothetical protein
MTDTIQLDLDHREVVRAVVKDSRVTCTSTSAPDVYVNAITPGDTQSLHVGDSSIVPKVTRVRLRLFRVDPAPDPFSARVEIAELPDDPKPLSETIVLDQNKKEVVRGIRRDSVIKCTKTSAPDVFVKTIDQQNKTSTILHVGDTSVLAKLSSIRFHLFRDNPGDAPFSAEVQIAEIPVDAKPDPGGGPG